MNDSAIYGTNSTFDGAFRWNPTKADLDEKITRLPTINCDIKRINEKLANIDKLPPEKAAAVQLEANLSLKKLKAKRLLVKNQIALAKEMIAKQIGGGGRSAKVRDMSGRAMSEGNRKKPHYYTSL